MNIVITGGTSGIGQSLVEKFVLKGDQVEAASTGGFYSKIDLGIVKYHFEIGAGKENFQWA